MNLPHYKRVQGTIMPPFYYGYSYTVYEADYDVWHIIPLNIIVRIVRRLKLSWDKLRGNRTYIDKEIRRRMTELYSQFYNEIEKKVEQRLIKIINENELGDKYER